MKKILLALTAGLMLSSCAQFLGGLRPDFDDGYGYDAEPTVGGRYAEGGQLSGGYYSGRDPAYSNPGHSEREAAAIGRMGGQGSWMDDENEERARRFTTRTADESNAPSYANNSNLAPNQKRMYKNGMRATRADFVDDAKDDGSLWTSDGQTNYYLTKNKINTVGDILTVTSDEAMAKDIAAELKRTLSPEERDIEIEIAQEKLRRRAMGLPEEAAAGAGADQVASTAASANRAPANIDKEKPVDVPTATWADVDLKNAIEFKAGDTFMAEVVERYPNGNYKIRGVKRVRYRNGYRMVNLTAIAKNADITDDQTIPAGKLYEYRLEALR